MKAGLLHQQQEWPQGRITQLLLLLLLLL